MLIVKAHFRGNAVALELAMEAARSFNLRVVYNIYSQVVLRQVQPSLKACRWRCSWQSERLLHDVIGRSDLKIGVFTASHLKHLSLCKGNCEICC